MGSEHTERRFFSGWFCSMTMCPITCLFQCSSFWWTDECQPSSSNLWFSPWCMSGIKDHYFETTEEIQYSASAGLRAVTMGTFKDDSSNGKITEASAYVQKGSTWRVNRLWFTARKFMILICKWVVEDVQFFYHCPKQGSHNGIPHQM